MNTSCINNCKKACKRVKSTTSVNKLHQGVYFFEANAETDLTEEDEIINELATHERSKSGQATGSMQENHQTGEPRIILSSCSTRNELSTTERYDLRDSLREISSVSAMPW